MKLLNQKKGKMLRYASCVLIFISFNFSCRKKGNDQTPNINSELTLQVEYNIDQTPFILDTMLYSNHAGNHYSISKIEYYLSNITFHGKQGDVVFSNIDYMNPADSRFSKTKMMNIPFGEYTGLTLHIGLDSVHNITGLLPHTIENENMAWPSPMGGGYHFLKFEGHFEDTGGVSGFAVHLGRNVNLVKVEVLTDFSIVSGQHVMLLAMNLNEWLQNPHTFNFLIDGKYTMNSLTAMKKISENGIDVMKLKELK